MRRGRVWLERRRRLEGIRCSEAKGTRNGTESRNFPVPKERNDALVWAYCGAEGIDRAIAPPVMDVETNGINRKFGPEISTTC
jgi:hypothetical protein